MSTKNHDRLKWFGESWLAPINSSSPHVETPVGERCTHCEEPIDEGEQGVVYAGNTGAAHLECFLRDIFGSVAHIRRECSCFVKGSTKGDPEGLTRREAARAAVVEYLERVPKQ